MKSTTHLALAAVLGIAVALPATASQGAPSRAATRSSPKDEAAQVVQLAVTSEGFVPAQVSVKAGKPVKLVVTRKTDQTCATEIVMKDFGVKQELPLDRPVTITVTPKKPGDYRYACGMDMVAGVLKAE